MNQRGRNEIKPHRALRSLAVLLFLSGISFATYFYALADIPRRDQFLYMAERAAMSSDWDWFWHSVSWSQTRFLRSGDPYLFRPLHMAVLALKDILFRSNAFASGAVNVSLMAVAGFSLYRFTSRLLKPVIAISISVLFITQHAGLEIVAWGHISPYLLALALFGFSLTEILEANPQEPNHLAAAGAMLLMGSMFHEALLVTLALALVALLYARWRGGNQARFCGTLPGTLIFRVIIVPVVLYLGLGLMNLAVYGVPRSTSISGEFLSGALTDTIAAILSFPGAAVVAFIAPFMVRPEYTALGLLRWDFSCMQPAIVVIGAATFIAALCATLLSIRTVRKGGGSPLAVVTLFALLMLDGLILGVGVGRGLMRDISYLYSSTYYYSMTAYVFCLLIAVGLHSLSGSTKSKNLMAISVTLIVALIAINFTMTHQTLKSVWPERSNYARDAMDYSTLLKKYSAKCCLSGSDGTVSMNTYSMLLRDYFCRPGDTRTRGFLGIGEDRKPELSIIRELIPAQPATEVALSQNGSFFLSADTYDKPDITLTVKSGFEAGVVLGYAGDDYLLFVIEGPLISAHTMKGTTYVRRPEMAAMPFEHPEHRLDVRHTGNYVYLFVDDYSLASIPSAEEHPGKVGLYVWRKNKDDVAHSDFSVSPSAIGGSFRFEPIPGP